MLSAVGRRPARACTALAWSEGHIAARVRRATLLIACCSGAVSLSAPGRDHHAAVAGCDGAIAGRRSDPDEATVLHHSAIACEWSRVDKAQGDAQMAEMLRALEGVGGAV